MGPVVFAVVLSSMHYEGDKPICLVVDFDVFSQKEWKARPPQ